MRRRVLQRVAVFVAIISGVSLFSSAVVTADRFEGTNYIIDASNIGAAFGGDVSSTSYSMTTLGGEAIIGNGLGGSYKLGEGYIAQLEQAMQISVQPAGLAAYYPFDENVGTRAHDDSINENNSIGQTSASWVPGKIASALAFTGSEYVEVPDAGSLDLPDDITVTAWVQPGVASQGASAIVSKTGASANYSIGVVATSNQAVFTVDCGGTTTVQSTIALTDTGQWYHVAGVKSGSDIHIYVNGQLEASATCASATATVNNAPLTIGAQTTSSGNYNGVIDEVKVFNRAFFEEEMLNEFDATDGGTPSALTFPPLIPGFSEQVAADVVIQTDAPSYSLALQQNGDMTNGTDTIDAITGTIGSPIPWSEGTTKGLGFTLTGGNIAIPGTWGSNPNFNYAALPNTSTTFLTRSGFTGGEKDILSMQYRLDVDDDQPAGKYQNTATYTGTILP